MTSSPRVRPHVVTLIDRPATAGGGAEVLALELLLALDPARYDRTYCVLSWHGQPGVDPDQVSTAERRLAEAGVELLALGRRGRWDLRAWAPLFHLLRSGEVDVLHSHKFGPNTWASLLRLLTRVPVFIAHEHTWSFEGDQLRRLLDRHLIARCADVFVSVSAEDRRRMATVERIPERKLLTVPNGIGPRVRAGTDVRAELGIPAESRVLGAVAILRPQKALDVLVRAVAQLAPAHPDLRLLVVGQGPERGRLEALTRELAIDDRVMFAGFRADIPDVLAALDVAVSSSLFEGSPLAVMEYMAASLPIVATAVGGVPDLIADGREGLLVRPGDVDALAAGIARVLDDRALAERLGDAARRRQQRGLTLENTARQMSSVYDRALTRKGRGLRVEPVAGGLEAAADDWRELAATAGSPFATHEWASAWWSHFGAGRLLQLLACRRRDGALAALLPLYRVRRGPLRVVRFLGHGPGDELGPVCAADDRPAALAALRRALDSGLLGADVLLAERLPGGAATESALDGLVLQREPNPAIDLSAASWEVFLAERSSNFRAQVRRRERRLRRDHDVRFRLTVDPESVATDLETVFALHDARWSGVGSGALAGVRGDFHRSFAARAAARGWLRLWILEVDGQAVAGFYGLRYGRRDWYYQSGRDPSWDSRSVGSVLLMHTIRSALEDGMAEYRLLRGGEDYKGRLATHDHPLATVVAGHGVIARAGVMLLGAAGPGRPALRERLRWAAG